jgi:hypothetical protein
VLLPLREAGGASSARGERAHRHTRPLFEWGANASTSTYSFYTFGTSTSYHHVDQLGVVNGTFTRP